MVVVVRSRTGWRSLARRQTSSHIWAGVRPSALDQSESRPVRLTGVESLVFSAPDSSTTTLSGGMSGAALVGVMMAFGSVIFW